MKREKKACQMSGIDGRVAAVVILSDPEKEEGAK
jgi:hypothetical protein